MLLTVLSVFAATAAPAPAPLADELIALEKQSWVAWQAHDGAFFERFLSADHVEMQGGGPVPGSAVAKAVAAGVCTVASWSVDRFQVTQLSDDAAVVTYLAKQDTTCGPVKVPPAAWATSVYIKRDGRWQNAVYVHTPPV